MAAIRVPVYFYEAAAARPDRVNLEDVRRGQFEVCGDGAARPGAAARCRRPEIHLRRGQRGGARSFLIAYNIFLDSPKTPAQAGGGCLGRAGGHRSGSGRCAGHPRLGGRAARGEKRSASACMGGPR